LQDFPPFGPRHLLPQQSESTTQLSCFAAQVMGATVGPLVGPALGEELGDPLALALG